MATIFTRRNGETGMAMAPKELPPTLAPLYAQCQETYAANQAARKAMTDALAKTLGDRIPKGKTLSVTFRFGQLNLAFVEPKETAKAAGKPVKETLSDWLDSHAG